MPIFDAEYGPAHVPGEPCVVVFTPLPFGEIVPDVVAAITDVGGLTHVCDGARPRFVCE